MNCKQCLYFDHDHHCGHHMTYTESHWRCSAGLEQDNRTPEEVENDIKKLEREIQSKVHGQHPVEDDPIHGDRKNLLESTFGLSTPDMLSIFQKKDGVKNELLGDYKIDKAGNLEDPVNHRRLS